MQKIIDKLFVRTSTNMWIQLIRYGFVGGFAFLFDYGTLFVLTEFAGLYHLVSAAIAFIIGLAVNYILSILWVFKQSVVKRKRIYEFVVFLITGIIGLGINELIIYVGTDVLLIHYMLSKLISTSMVFFWNFFARKVILFSN